MSAHRDTETSLLLRHAAGHLDAGFALLIETHLAFSEKSRQLHAQFEALGGVYLDDLAPAGVDPSALNQALCSIEGEFFDHEPAQAHPVRHPRMPEGFALPSPLSSVEMSAWRWIAPGVRSTRVTLPKSARSRAFVLEIAPGVTVPRHGHDGDEATCVLKGGFRDGDAHYCPGDIAYVDERIEHEIVIDPGEPCLCLIAMEGRTRPNSWFGRLYQKFRDI